MAKLIIKGDAKQLKQIATQIRLRVRKYGLVVETKGFDKKEKEVKPTPPAGDVLTLAKDIIALVEKATSVEEFKMYIEDTRATVVKAIEVKTIELTDEN